MKLKSLSTVEHARAVLGTTACQKSSPTRPSDRSGGHVWERGRDRRERRASSVTTPSLTSPTANQTFKFVDQPLTLTVKNAVHTRGKSAATYTFDVATDAAFATKVYSKDGVAEGSGSTSLKIDTLPGPAAKSYFWRARLTSAARSASTRAVRGFIVGAQVVDSGAASVVADRPAARSARNGTLSVVNAARTGPVGTMSYRFDVSDTLGVRAISSSRPPRPEQPARRA